MPLLYYGDIMKLNMSDLTPVSNHWNVYIEDSTQKELFYPVIGLALIKDDIFEWPWVFIDLLHIEAQTNPETFEDKIFMHTIYSKDEPK